MQSRETTISSSLSCHLSRNVPFLCVCACQMTSSGDTKRPSSRWSSENYPLPRFVLEPFQQHNRPQCGQNKACIKQPFFLCRMTALLARIASSRFHLYLPSQPTVNQTALVKWRMWWEFANFLASNLLLEFTHQLHAKTFYSNMQFDPKILRLFAFGKSNAIFSIQHCMQTVVMILHS